MNSIQSVHQNLTPAALNSASSTASPSNSVESFKTMLIDSIEQVNSVQQDADKAVQALVTGGDVNAAEVMTALQKADMSFRMMLQVRNKLVQAFQELKEIRI